MKSNRTVVKITEQMVTDYESIFGEQKSLPPSFPMLFYKYIDVPWEYGKAPIHRKQKCYSKKELVIGNAYYCEVLLDRKVVRGKNVFYSQTLIGCDEKGEECFRCVSELVVRLP